MQVYQDDVGRVQPQVQSHLKKMARSSTWADKMITVKTYTEPEADQKAGLADLQGFFKRDSRYRSSAGCLKDLFLAHDLQWD